MRGKISASWLSLVTHRHEWTLKRSSRRRKKQQARGANPSVCVEFLFVCSGTKSTWVWIRWCVCVCVQIGWEEKAIRDRSLGLRLCLMHGYSASQPKRAYHAPDTQRKQAHTHTHARKHRRTWTFFPPAVQPISLSENIKKEGKHCLNQTHKYTKTWVWSLNVQSKLELFIFIHTKNIVF